MKKKFLVIIFTALCVSAISLGGCASKKKQKTVENFDETIRLYGRLLRWNEVEGAVNLIRHQDESTVEVNLDEYKDLRVVDYEVKKVTLDDDFKTAEVEADITYYFETTNNVKDIRDTQSWWYDEEAEKWFLDDDLPAF